MSIPVIGIFIVAGIAIVLGVLCMISDLWPKKSCDEIPDGYWEKLEEYLHDRPELPEEAEGDDPDPLI